MKNVYTPLLEIATYKKSQSKKMYSFRQTFESTLSSAEEGLYKVSNHITGACYKLGGISLINNFSGKEDILRCVYLWNR